jgi:hypothetical protein
VEIQISIDFPTSLTYDDGSVILVVTSTEFWNCLSALVIQTGPKKGDKRMKVEKIDTEPVNPFPMPDEEGTPPLFGLD